MLMHTLGPRLKRTMGDLIENRKLNAGPITMHYVDAVATEPDFDPNLESSYPDRVQKKLCLGALIHIVSARTTQRQFSEIQTGDAIVTFEADVDFSGKDEIRFEFNGDTWVQQAVGKELRQYWDAIIGGEPMFQTMVLRMAS